MPSVNVTWLLDDLAERVPGIERVVKLSCDGLPVGASGRLDKDEAERLAAIAAGFQSLARGAADYLDASSVRQVIVEMHGRYLFVNFNLIAMVAVTGRQADPATVEPQNLRLLWLCHAPSSVADHGPRSAHTQLRRAGANPPAVTCWWRSLSTPGRRWKPCRSRRWPAPAGDR